MTLPRGRNGVIMGAYYHRSTNHKIKDECNCGTCKAPEQPAPLMPEPAGGNATSGNSTEEIAPLSADFFPVVNTGADPVAMAKPPVVAEDCMGKQEGEEFCWNDWDEPCKVLSPGAKAAIAAAGAIIPALVVVFILFWCRRRQRQQQQQQQQGSTDFGQFGVEQKKAGKCC